jgi:hypothetical protein
MPEAQRVQIARQIDMIANGQGIREFDDEGNLWHPVRIASCSHDRQDDDCSRRQNSLMDLHQQWSLCPVLYTPPGRCYHFRRLRHRGRTV